MERRIVGQIFNGAEGTGPIIISPTSAGGLRADKEQQQDPTRLLPLTNEKPLGEASSEEKQPGIVRVSGATSCDDHLLFPAEVMPETQPVVSLQEHRLKGAVYFQHTHNSPECTQVGLWKTLLNTNHGFTSHRLVGIRN